MLKNYPHLLLICLLATSFVGCDTHEAFIPEPTVQNISPEQAEIIRLFSQLTGNDPSACNLIFDLGDISSTLCNIVIDAEPGSEIIFLVDNTGSMEDDIDEVKRNINDIIDCLPQGVRLGAATYGDNRADPFNWFSSIDLTEQYGLVRAFINAITVVGGGDIPESVYDGIYRVLDEMSWLDCSAPDRIIVMGDAPPHTGSLTDYEIDDVLAKSQSICTDTEFYPVIVIDL